MQVNVPQELQFERTLAFHCAPALAGIKPADLISWPGTPEETDTLLKCFSTLSNADICLRLLCRRGARCLILVYRREHLRRQLAREEVRTLLRRDGYPVDRGTEATLEHLAKRLAVPGDFPHEVGLFLGYPAGDVEGFRRDGGRGCKYSGLWKVYDHVEHARRRFDQYRCCRQGLCRRVLEGQPLGELFRRPVKAVDTVFLS